MTKRSGTFRLTKTARALWDAEVTGQLSDGTWENARPHDHWKFWCDLESEEVGSVHECDVVLNPERRYAVRKNAYDIIGLMDCKFDGSDEYILRGRMLKHGRLALAGAPVESIRAAEHMPDTYEEWRRAKDSNEWKFDFIAHYMEGVTDEVARRFYDGSVTYEVDDLKRDLNLIKKEMRLVPRD